MTGRSRGSQECDNRPFTRSKFQYFPIISIMSLLTACFLLLAGYNFTLWFMGK